MHQSVRRDERDPKVTRAAIAEDATVWGIGPSGKGGRADRVLARVVKALKKVVLDDRAHRSQADYTENVS
jgi:hypothetical protein